MRSYTSLLMDAPYMVNMDLAPPLARKLTETDVTSQQALFDLPIHRNLRHTTTINRR